MKRNSTVPKEIVALACGFVDFDRKLVFGVCEDGQGGWEIGASDLGENGVVVVGSGFESREEAELALISFLGDMCYLIIVPKIGRV